MAVKNSSNQQDNKEKTLLQPSASPVGFSIGLYLEHLEEASFLYEQRLTLFEDPEITWLDIEDFEDRFEPHIDGLVVGEHLALDVCRQQATEGDFGELHAAVRVFCRQNRLDLLQEVLDELDPEDEERVNAVCDALKHELPMSWKSEFLKLLTKGDKKYAPIVATVAGYRRLPVCNELSNMLHQYKSGALSTLVWALGRIRDNSSCDMLMSYMKDEDKRVCGAAALALLRMGDFHTLEECSLKANQNDWPFIPLGLGGNRSYLSVLLERAPTGNNNTECPIALGLLGDITAIDILLEKLTISEFAESAASALNLITGAGLYEDVFIPEDIDEDELFDGEREKLERGENLYPPGEEPGITINILSQNPDTWEKWWQDHRLNFKSEIRYRNGKPYSPVCLLANLQHERSPRLIRDLAYEELVIRYGIDFPFETDMPVKKQQAVLAQYAEWVKENNSRFEAGKWYFAGKLMS